MKKQEAPTLRWNTWPTRANGGTSWSMDNKKTKSLVGSIQLVALLIAIGLSGVLGPVRNSKAQLSASPRPPIPTAEVEYLWYEAENMRGITETSRHEPLLNPSYLEIPAAKAPGWAISGPGAP